MGENKKFHFSIFLDKGKKRLKDKFKILNKFSWMKYGVVIIISMLLGGALAFYQYGINDNKGDYQFLSSGNNEKEPAIILQEKDREKSYTLDKEELILPDEESRPEETNKRIEEEAIKVSASSSGQSLFNNMIKPVTGEIIIAWREPYKDRILEAWKFNSGIDIKANIGDKVKATSAGQIEEIIKDDYRGTTIIISHKQRIKTLYANLQSSNLEVGAKINQGAIIGEVGDGGLNSESGLHFEVIKVEDGIEKRVDPMKYIN